MDKMSNLASNVYGLLLGVGGIMGYVKAHSKWSLITGIMSWIVILVACNVGSKDAKSGYLFIATLCLILSNFFSLRFGETHAFMPAGFMLIASVLTYFVIATSWFKNVTD